MVQTLVEVIEEFDPTTDYGIEVRKQYRMCLSVLKKGQKINTNEFIKNQLDAEVGPAFQILNKINQRLASMPKHLTSVY